MLLWLGVSMGSGVSQAGMVTKSLVQVQACKGIAIFRCVAYACSTPYHNTGPHCFTLVPRPRDTHAHTHTRTTTPSCTHAGGQRAARAAVAARQAQGHCSGPDVVPALLSPTARTPLGHCSAPVREGMRAHVVDCHGRAQTKTWFSAHGQSALAYFLLSTRAAAGA